ncbi:MAG: uL15 family ribosomal protein, partial [Nanoarchaeota archaeon]
KKTKKMHGHGMGTHGRGSRKKAKKSGHHGGPGMSGSGKRADQKKTLVLKLYGHHYFGKQGVTSRGTKRDKRKRINLRTIETNLDNFVKKGIAKKTKEGFEINLHDFKILGSLEEYKLKNKLVIKAKEASRSAIEKVKNAGGEIQLK